MSCPAGYYSASAAVSSCSGCAAGYFSTNTGKTSACTSSCAAGTYSAEGASSCTNCVAGAYSAAGALSCIRCSTGYFSTTGATSCDATLHDFDFRGCITGEAVTDAFSLTATPYDGPTCSSSGIYLDGVNDHLMLTSWNWGGATSFEVFVNYQVFNGWSRIFDFGAGQASYNVLFANVGTASTAAFDGA